jgi:hypothetical protein
MLAGVLVPLGFFAMVTLIVVFIVRYRNQERMEIIKNGMVPFPAIPGKGPLMWGLLLTFVGVAFSVAVMTLGIEKEALMAGAIACSMGIALLLYYKLTIPDREKAAELHRAMIEASAGKSRPDDSTEEAS